MRRKPTRRMAAAVAGVMLTGGLAACGSDDGPPVLNWYINNLQQAEIGDACTEKADGAYRISPELLPNNASGQREQLLRRLAANDSSIDIMSLDPPFMAEFGHAGFLREFTAEEREEFSEGVLKGPLEQSLYDDKMFSAPFYGNTQLLWYKKSVAEAAGLDMSQPVTWDQLIEAAEATDTVLAVQGRRNESLMVWVNALVQSAGGTILDPDSQGLSAAEVQPTIDSEAGAEAARIIRAIADSVAPPAMSTAGEEESRAAFQSDRSGFMVNWPYVWAAFKAGQEDGSLPENFTEDVGWAPYPRVDADTPTSTPLGGIGLSIGAFTEHEDLAVEAVRCIRSLESQVQYMLLAGDPAILEDAYEDPGVLEAFPMADTIKEGLIDAGPRPISPFYGDVTGVIQQEFHPPNALSPETTPRNAGEALSGVLANERLL